MGTDKTDLRMNKPWLATAAATATATTAAAAAAAAATTESNWIYSIRSTLDQRYKPLVLFFTSK